jgi:V/A-type H+-transporting ATPase subunit B
MLEYRDIHGVIYRGVREIRGSLVILDPIPGVGYDEIVKVRAPDGVDRLGRVLEVGEDGIVVQIFGEESGLQVDTVVKFTGSAFEIRVSEDCIGRIFNGRYEPIDGMKPSPRVYRATVNIPLLTRG